VTAETPRAGQTGLVLLAGFAFARLVFDTTLGLGRDEAYTLVVSRRLALSYFDHPPLHQWLAHYSALAFGETVFARTPFVVLFALTGWLVYMLGRELFSERAGLVALVALNVSPFFFASAGGWIVPDGPLLAALVAAALALARVLFRETTPRETWALWIAAGAAFGLAGLSKYSAVLSGLGLFAFLIASPRHRRWFAHPAPYVAALLALALFAPALIWNADNDWVSLRFQSARGSPSGKFGFGPVLGNLLAQIAYLTPWVFAGFAAGVLWAQRAWRRGDDRGMFLVCLASPPILLFTLTPLWGPHGLPHWSMPGWFFLYPLLGAALAERNLRRSGAASAAFIVVVFALLVVQADFGVAQQLAGRDFSDPTLEALDWRELKAAIGAPADFVVVTKWWEAGKAGVALGPETPIFVFSDDPRGVAFLDDSARFVGRDADLVVERDKLAATQDALRPYFQTFEAPRFVALRRGGRVEVELAVVRARNLTHAFAAPYRQRRS